MDNVAALQVSERTNFHFIKLHHSNVAKNNETYIYKSTDEFIPGTQQKGAHNRTESICNHVLA